MARGRIVTFESLDPQIALSHMTACASALRFRGLDVVEVKEFAGTPGAQEIWQLLDSPDERFASSGAKALLRFAAANDVGERLVSPALARGDWVVAAGLEYERFTTSSTQAFPEHLMESLRAGAPRVPPADLILIVEAPQGARTGQSEPLCGAPESPSRGRHMSILKALAIQHPSLCQVIEAGQNGGDSLEQALTAIDRLN